MINNSPHKNIKAYNKQVKYSQDIIDKLGLSICTCGNCGTVVINNTEKNTVYCYHCGYYSDTCDFPELFYHY